MWHSALLPALKQKFVEMFKEGALFGGFNNFRRMLSLPGALPLAGVLMALLSCSMVGGASSSFMTGVGSMFSTAVLVTVVSLKYSSW